MAIVRSSTSGGQLAGFLGELIGVLDDAVGVDGLFDGALYEQIRTAWDSVKDGLGRSLEEVPSLSEESLRIAGLTGAQLDLKLRAWELHRDEWRSELDSWRAATSVDSSLDRLKRVSSKLLRLASTILGSLLLVGALPGVEALKEIVDTLESLL